MPTDRELLQQALDALTYKGDRHWAKVKPVIEALRARLAQPDPEPVAWMAKEVYQNFINSEGTETEYVINIKPQFEAVPLYESISNHDEWVDLTDEETMAAWAPVVKQYFNPQYGAHTFDVLGVNGASMVMHLSRAIQKAFKEKNNGK